MDPTVKVQQALKAKVMLWTGASYHDMGEIDKMRSIPDLESTLCSVFQIDLPEPRRGVLLELYVQTILFCRRCSYKKDQTSTLLSIIKSIHEANVGTPVNNLEQCSEYCNELLLCHSVRRPPFSINLFSPEEVTCILKYIHNSYIRHYKLYKYVFTPQVKLDLSLAYSGINDQEEPSMEDSAAPAENAITEAGAKTERSPETEETSITEPEGAPLGSKSELKALIEQEVREQVRLVSGKCDQRMKEIADQHQTASLSLPQGQK